MSTRFLRYVIALTVTIASPLAVGQEEPAMMGPLRVHPENPRWFQDPAGRAVWLTGSHTWANLQQRGVAAETPDFSYDRYLDFLQRHGHNFIRLWVWEHAQWMQFVPREVPVRYEPLPYQRTGPRKALDGKPKFDLTRFNEAYFARLLQRVTAARQHNIYVGVMLFQGFSLDKTRGNKTNGNAWLGHPFHGANNINGIDGNPSGDETGREVHTLKSPTITALQEAYVRKVIDTVGHLDNVLWEIGNECHIESVAWQYHMIRFINEYESSRRRQHPVGMTGAPIQPEPLFNSPADWISPPGRPWLTDPKANEGNKAIIVDTDHCHPWDHNPDWVWKNFLCGNHFILMDGYMDFRLGSPDQPNPEWDVTRQAMGHVRRLAASLDLAKMVPQPQLSSTGYCLADTGSVYLVYQPDPKGGPFTVAVKAGAFAVQWIDSTSGRVVSRDLGDTGWQATIYVAAT